MLDGDALDLVGQGAAQSGDVAGGGCRCHRVDDHGVVESGRVVVMAGRLVGLRSDDQHAVLIGVVGGGLGEGGVVDRAQGLLDDAGAVVNGVEHGLGPVVDVG